MKKKSTLQKVKIIVSIVFILSGVILGCVPIFAPIMTQKHQDSVIKNYQNNVSKMTQEELQQAKSEAKEYNNSSDEEGRSNYYAAIDQESVISFIDIPSIDVHLPIYKGTDEDTLERGIGWLEKTSYPIGGKGTHCVLSGHSGLVTQTMFSNLSKMEVGDKFYLNTFDEVLCYKAYDIVTVEPDEVNDYIVFDKDHDYCMLLTCTPIGINTHRLLVLGERCEDTESNTVSTEETTSSFSSITESPSVANVKETEETSHKDSAQNSSSELFAAEYVFCLIISLILEVTGIILFISTLRELSKADKAEK